MPANQLRIETTDRYRTVAEERIVEFLLSPYEIAVGARALDLPVAKAILDRCIALGLPHKLSTDGHRLFDLVEVQNFIRYAYFRWGERVWRDRNVPIFRQLMSHTGPGAPLCNPPALALPRSGCYAIKIVREFNLAKHRTGDLVRLRLPLPIADPTTRGSSSSFIPLDSCPAEVSFDEARLDIRLTVPECKCVEMGVLIKLNFQQDLEKPPTRLEANEIALYTRESEGYIKLNDRIKELSLQISSSCSDRLAIIYSVWDFMFDELTLGAIHYDKIDTHAPLDWILDNRLYDCRVGSALAVALCRALAIPARLIAGYTLNPVLPTMHTWFEVWFDDSGWLPFDLYSMVLCADDRDSPWRHYFFGRIDHRLVTERLPRLFSGLGSVRLPASWQLISAARDDGVVLSFENQSTGDLIYSEKINVSIIS
jgi:hypothetical protein